MDYAYDDQVHTHNVSVTDSFGYVSTARYNLKFGKVVNTTDINNQPLDYTYDKFGRVATIVGPYQTGSGLETIRFAYHPEADDPWALTTHIDVYRDQNDPIETVLFTDGLKRVLQTKKDATIHTGIETAAQAVMTVSGHVSYDFIGRSIEQYYPITEALGRQGVSIHYPQRIDNKGKTLFPPIDVRYSYGEPGAADNRANRIITVEDQSGMEERFYGPLGETVKSV